MIEPSAALRAFAVRWETEEPALHYAAMFGRSAAAQVSVARLIWVAELVEAVYCLSERHISEAKLGWWIEEIGQWRAGTPRHPITSQLHALRVVAPDLAQLETRIIALLNDPSCADHAALLAEQQRWLQLIDPVHADVLALWALWLRLRRMERHRSDVAAALPLSLLARHQLRPAALNGDSPERAAAVRDHAAALRAAPATSNDPVYAALIAQLHADLREIGADPARRSTLRRRPLARLWQAWRAASAALRRQPASA